MLSPKPAFSAFVLISITLYVLIGYYIERHETPGLFTCYFLAFVVYVLIIHRYRSLDRGDLIFLIAASLLFRLVLVFAVPALSDDFYRFVWDGRLVAAGVSPFSHVPSAYMSGENPVPGLNSELFDKLNSKGRFSSYPPVCQSIFWLAAMISPDSVYGSMVVMKTILLLFELGTFWILMKLIRSFGLHPATILIYAMNPLVVIEITGNLHFEGVMIFFLISGIYLLKTGRLQISSAALALSICTKLIPLLFLPLFARIVSWRRVLLLWICTGVICLLLFAPFLNQEIVNGFSRSLRYYFQQFEFNASIYYLVRGAGYLLFGFNIIQFAGPFLAVVAMVMILVISFRKPDGVPSGNVDLPFFKGMVWCLFIYFVSTTTLHPWYIITLLGISLFTDYRFPVLWTGLIFLTYAGYTVDSFNENFWVVGLEYVILFTYMLYETIWSNRKIAF